MFAILKFLQSLTFGGLGEPTMCSLTTEKRCFRWITHPGTFPNNHRKPVCPELDEFLHRSRIFEMKRFGIFSNECLMNYQVQPSSYF
jgi:hypothetical protein